MSQLPWYFSIFLCSDDDNEGERGEEGGGEEVGGEDGRELTLAEQFEQIRRCRYIRHYRPHGTAVEEL